MVVEIGSAEMTEESTLNEEKKEAVDLLRDRDFFKEWFKGFGLGMYLEYKAMNGFTIESFGGFENVDKFDMRLLQALTREVGEKLPVSVDYRFRFAYKCAYNTTYNGT